MVMLLTLNSEVHGSRKVVILKVGMFVRILYFLGIPKILKTLLLLLLFLEIFFLNGKTLLGDLHEFTCLSCLETFDSNAK